MGAVVCVMRRLLFIKRWTELKKSKTNKASALIAFSSYFASKRAAKFGIFFIVFGTSLLLPLDSAGATATGPVNVICANAQGEQRTFTPSWDNSNRFFNGKGQISRLFCEGGYAGEYRVFVSNNLTDSSLDYYNGIVPVVTPPVVAESVTPTSVSDSSTAQTQPTETDTQTVNPDTSTVTVSDTPTQTVDSPTVVSVVDSPTVTNQNQNPDTPTVSTTTESASVVNPSSRDDSSTTLTVTDSQTVTLETSTSISDTATVTPPVQSPAQTQPIEPPSSPSPTPAPSVSEPVVVVVEPVPAQPQPVPDPDPVIDPPAPEPQEQPVVDPQPTDPVDTAPAEPDPVISEPVSEPETPALTVTEPVDPTPTQTPDPAPVDTQSIAPQPFQPSQSPVSVLSVDVATLPPDTPVELENGVILTAEVVVALELLDNPGELLASIITDPAQALKAIANIGADMTPEDRKKAQTTTVAAVLTGAAIRRMN